VTIYSFQMNMCILTKSYRFCSLLSFFLRSLVITRKFSEVALKTRFFLNERINKVILSSHFST